MRQTARTIKRSGAGVGRAPVWTCLFAALLLAACGSSALELPDNDSDGTLKASPCACLELDDYDDGGFEWRAG